MHYSARKTASAEAGILAVASRFETATKRLLDSRSLLSRTDTKFIVPSTLAVWILAKVADDYNVVMPGPSPLAPYVTDYFDTADLQCFYDEIDGTIPRYKVRVRRYQDGKSFVETKATDPSGRTRKDRLLRVEPSLDLSPIERELVASRTDLPVNELTRSIGIDYDRLTMVSPNSDERVTVDLNVVVRVGASRIPFPDVTIFETKQRCQGEASPMAESLISHGITPSTLSKYCSALALVDESLAVGRAAEMLLRLRGAEKRNESLDRSATKTSDAWPAAEQGARQVNS